MNRPKSILAGLTAAAIFLLVLPALADMRMWVAVDDLKRRTCPSAECGVVGRFFFQESIFVFETVKGWSRVTHFRSAGCYDGKSIYVETGRRDCSPENGIVEGEYAEWVESKFLVDERPDRLGDMHG